MKKQSQAKNKDVSPSTNSQQKTKSTTASNFPFQNNQQTSSLMSPFFSTSFPFGGGIIDNGQQQVYNDILKIYSQQSKFTFDKFLAAVLLFAFSGYISWIAAYAFKNNNRKEKIDFITHPHPPNCLLPTHPHPLSSSNSSFSRSSDCGGGGGGGGGGGSPSPCPAPAPSPCPAPAPCTCGSGGSNACVCNVTYLPCSTPAAVPSQVVCKYNIYDRFDHINDEMKYAKYTNTVNNYLLGAKIFDIESTVDALKENIEILPDNVPNGMQPFVPSIFALTNPNLGNLNQTLDEPCASYTFNSNVLVNVPPTPTPPTPFNGIQTVYRIDISARSLKVTNALSSTVTNDTIVSIFANGITTGDPIAKFVIPSSTSTIPITRKIFIKEDIGVLTSLTLSTQYNGLVVTALEVYGVATV